ncbi:succinyldiaminopimelate transaminase [Ectothiorhodospiraceae bacterium BW-2]|nr:succinyldiaminopimelate transaminase [Ectothiorhodospiraceae bacterium BW-2]
MNQDLTQLHPYPFEKLRQRLGKITPPSHLEPIQLSIGEPQHAPPPFATKELCQQLESDLARYPLTQGEAALREAIARWLQRRFKLKSVDPDTEVLPVAGTREALFAVAQALTNRADRAIVMMPNPFYQIYEGAALLAGAEPYYLHCHLENNFLPDLESIPTEIWQRCQLFYLCSPGNPSGRVAPLAYLKRLLELARRHDVTLVADECYSEIYPNESDPPPGLLQAAQNDYRHCLVFHSLSKRSNLPGLRSGFVAGDSRLIRQFLSYRTYHGCALPLATQRLSRAAWEDESHVIANRDSYRQKFAAVTDILTPLLPITPPEAGFYLWARCPGDDTDFAAELYRQCHITVLPGQYLSRSVKGYNPGFGYVRMALVAPLEQTITAAKRIHHYLATI